MEQFSGTYIGSGTWHDAVGKSGHYRIQHTHAASADGFEVSFTHNFDDGTVVDAHFTMKWIAPSLFAVFVAGTQVGNGYVFEDFFQYHLKIGDKFVQVGYHVDDHLRVCGSSSTNAEGHYTAWAERLLRTPG